MSNSHGRLKTIQKKIDFIETICQEDAEWDILSQFDKNDLKGSYDIRNYIAHDYEGVNLGVIEHIIRDKLPKIKAITENLLSTDLN